MNKPIIEFRNITKVYSVGFWGKKQIALKNLNLKVPPGSIYGFLGANGAGKTTGIKLLMGLQFPQEGSLFIFGKEANDPAAKANLGYLPERPYFHDSMTAKEFLNFHRSLFGDLLKNKKIPTNQELLNLVGLQNVEGKYLKDFSKGMLQRIGIAQALVNDPDLIVLDEPMSGLDPVGRREVRDLIVNLSQKGKTIFFSSHILSDVESICHRIAFLEKGELKFEGTIKDIQLTEKTKHELIFSGIDEIEIKKSAALKEAQLVSDAYILRCEDESAGKKAIEEIFAKNGKLKSYHPIHKTLEDFLFGKEDSK